MRRVAVCVGLVAGCLIGACSDDGPTSNLETVLSGIADAEDGYYEEHGGYTIDPDVLLTGASQEELEAMNIIIDIDERYGYCVEGEDDNGTWHLAMGNEEPSKGECPEGPES